MAAIFSRLYVKKIKVVNKLFRIQITKKTHSKPLLSKNSTLRNSIKILMVAATGLFQVRPGHGRYTRDTTDMHTTHQYNVHVVVQAVKLLKDDFQHHRFSADCLLRLTVVPYISRTLEFI